MVFHLLRSCADQYLGLLYGQMKEEFLKSRYIHCDETRMQVIDEPDQKGSSQNWMWVYLISSSTLYRIPILVIA